LRYIKGIYSLDIINSNGALIKYIDFDWEMDVDDRKSTLFLYHSYSREIMWQSKKQVTITLSISKVEYRGGITIGQGVLLDPRGPWWVGFSTTTTHSSKMW